MSVAITTPWEGGTGYVTHVAFKYAGQETGDHVTFSEARHARKASACWAGTTAESATIRLATRHVTVSGYDGPPHSGRPRLRDGHPGRHGAR